MVAHPYPTNCYCLLTVTSIVNVVPVTAVVHAPLVIDSDM